MIIQLLPMLHGLLYFRKSYIGWDPEMDELDSLICRLMRIGTNAIEARRKKYMPTLAGERGGAFHVTLVTPPELNKLTEKMGQPTPEHTAHVLLEELKPLRDSNASWMTMTTQTPLKLERFTNDKGETWLSHLLPIKWPMAHRFRGKLGLEETLLHFTLGLEKERP